MNDAQFNACLEAGREQEDNLADALTEAGYVATVTSKSYEKVPGWDVSTKECDVCPEILIEVKYDKMAAQTGNVCIEFEARDAKGNKRDSGLSATTSHLCVFKFPDLMGFFSIATDKLKKLLSDKVPNRILWGGYGSYSHLALIDRDIFLSYCDKFPKYISDNTGVFPFTTQSNS